MAIVREARESDIPHILELYNDLTSAVSPTDEKYHPSPDAVQQVITEITSMPGHKLLVAEENGNIVGTLVLLIVPNLSHGALPWAIVENAVVDQKLRRRGIGKLLMEYAINHARKVGCYKVQLFSNKKRQEAHQFYRSLGFQASAHGFRLYL